MYIASSPLGFLHQMEAIVFIGCRQAAAERAENELAGGGAQVIICSALDALQTYMQ